MPRGRESGVIQVRGWVLGNLGLGEGSALPVGVPVPWPSATAPAGWLKYNGAAFDKARYPKLAAVYPNGVLPDLRGEFIRGWDDGRGVDAGRGLLGLQTQMSLDHLHYLPTAAGPAASPSPNGKLTAVFKDQIDILTYYPDGTDIYNPNPTSTSSLQTYYAKYNSSSFGSESRPRNIAFNYIVRAA